MARQHERLLIWGGGGHGKVVADVARGLGYTVAGFIDADPAKLGSVVEPGGACVVMSEHEFTHVLKDMPTLADDTAIGLAIGDNARRIECAQLLAGVELPVLAHETACISESAAVGRGTVVLPGAVINAAVRVGSAVIINTGAIVEHDCVIGDGVHVSPGAVLCGAVHVGAGAWIGAGATVIQGVRIGARAVVGAGAVVIRNVEDGDVVAGCPAVSIRKAFDTKMSINRFMIRI